MNPAAAHILDQLPTPDRIGRDLALLRTRLYRFSDDLRWYVLAETLEEHLLEGRQPQPATISAVRACLAQIRRNGSSPAFQLALAAAESIDITAALAERAAYTWQQVPLATPPSTVVLIVGAPRSGTSHLFNLLAATGKFAYLTTASCWAWPVRNLHQPGRHPFTDVGDAVLEVDNKRTRIIPGLVMPGEAEDIWHRAMPVYQHIRGHRYEISPAATAGDVRILQAAAHAHLAHFRRTVLLAKSPFNSFRIPRSNDCGETRSGTSTSSVTSARRPTRCAATTSSSPQTAICLLENRLGHGSLAQSTTMRLLAGRRPSRTSSS